MHPLLPLPPNNSTLAKLNISNVCPPIFSHSQSPIKDSSNDSLVSLPVPPTLCYSYTPIKDGSNDNLVCTQTSSPTYLLPQPHRETATTTILSASRLQSHLPCSTATPPSKTAATTILPASGVPIPPSISMPRVMFCQDAKEDHRVTNTTATCLTNSLLSAPLSSAVVKHIHPHRPLHHPDDHPIPKLS